MEYATRLSILSVWLVSPLRGGLKCSENAKIPPERLKAYDLML